MWTTFLLIKVANCTWFLLLHSVTGDVTGDVTIVTLACQYRHISSYSLGPLKNTSNAWKSFLCTCSIFKVQNLWDQVWSTLGFHSLFCFICYHHCLWTCFGGTQHETKAENPSVFALQAVMNSTPAIICHILCHYVTGLFNRVQTNYKHKRKGMLFRCEQLFLWDEHCVTYQKTAMNETSSCMVQE